MTRYELLRLLHILGEIAWIGSGVGLFALSRQLHAAGEHAALLAGIRQSKALGNRVFVPAALVTLLSGVGLILLEGAARFADAWIVAGVGVLVAVVVAMVLRPTW